MNAEQIPPLNLDLSIVDITIPPTVADTIPELMLTHHEDYKKYKLPCIIHDVQPERVSNVPLSFLRHQYFEGLYIPYSDDAFDRTNRALESIFASIECLTAIFDSCCCQWRLYYGTQMISNKYVYSKSSAYHTKNYALHEMLLKIDKKRHNPLVSKENPWGVDQAEDYILSLEALKPRREFCVAEVIITRQQPELNGPEMISVSFNRLRGCRVTSAFIANEIRNNLMSVLEQTPVVFANTRSPLLLLAEGTDSNFKEEHPHISRYLLNDLLVREICTFIPHRKYI